MSKTATFILRKFRKFEYSRHRSFVNVLVNFLAGLIAYTYQEKRPSLQLPPEDLKQLYAAFGAKGCLALPMATFL
jgi:hypothetical protein